MQSARRLRDRQNYQLPLRKMPRRSQSSTVWIASVVAAAVGWIVGIAFPLGEEQSTTDLALFTAPDTIVQYREKVVHDTVVKHVNVPVPVKVASASPKRAEPYTGMKGCNVECDGIDYSLLVGM